MLGVAVAVLGVLGGCTAESSAEVIVYAETVGPAGQPQAAPLQTERSTVLPAPPGEVPTSAPTPSVSESSAPAAAASPSAPAEPEAAFRAAVWTISDALAARMSASWRPGCPVPLEDLRYVTVTHWDMAGQVRVGELVVHADVADGLVDVFRALFEARYPIASMRLVDDFDASDDASMAADNTSAFNCRAITGGSSWSEHAYGRAIDVNPVENPYVRASGRAAPPAGAAFVDRHAAPGVIQPDDVVVRAFAAAGWQWGGYWDYPIDYQHFSTTGR